MPAHRAYDRLKRQVGERRCFGRRSPPQGVYVNRDSADSPKRKLAYLTGSLSLVQRLRGPMV